MATFSERIHAGLAEIEKEAKLLPQGLPSDTREAAALAEAAKGVAVTLDPELEPLFGAIGAAGDAVERGLSELSGHVSNLKKVLATRGVAPVQRPSAAAADASPAGSGAPTRKPTFSSRRAASPAAETTGAGSSIPPTAGAPSASTQALTSEESGFEKLSPEDRAAFEAAEHLDAEPF